MIESRTQQGALGINGADSWDLEVKNPGSEHLVDCHITTLYLLVKWREMIRLCGMI